MSPLSGFPDTTLTQAPDGVRCHPFERVTQHVACAGKASRTTPTAQGPAGRRKCVWFSGQRVSDPGTI